MPLFIPTLLLPMSLRFTSPQKKQTNLHLSPTKIKHGAPTVTKYMIVLQDLVHQQYINNGRHLRKCCPQPLIQLSPEANQWSNTAGDNDELVNQSRAAKKLKYVIEDLQLETDMELMEIIWMNKRNIGLLEQKLPDKAIAIKEAINCYEGGFNLVAGVQAPKRGCHPAIIEDTASIVEIQQKDSYFRWYCSCSSTI